MSNSLEKKGRRKRGRRDGRRRTLGALELTLSDTALSFLCLDLFLQRSGTWRLFNIGRERGSDRRDDHSSSKLSHCRNDEPRG